MNFESYSVGLELSKQVAKGPIAGILFSGRGVSIRRFKQATARSNKEKNETTVSLVKIKPRPLLTDNIACGYLGI